MKHRCWLLVVIVMGIAGVSCVARTKEIRATSFVVEDYQGKRRAELGMSEGKSTLQLFGENEGPRIVMSVGEAGPIVSLLDETGMPRIGLSVAEDSPQMSLLDETGTARIGLSVAKDSPQISLFDKTGTARIELIMSEPGAGLALSDKTGTIRIGLSVTESETGIVLFYENFEFAAGLGTDTGIMPNLSKTLLINPPALRTFMPFNCSSLVTGFLVNR